MHYLDNSATTAVSPAAAQKALEIMTGNFGNPSSLHTLGIRAEHELEAARKEIALAIGADSGEITFTSGGTEANNLAVFGAAEAKRRTCKRVIISSVEHSSVLEAAKRLADDGFEVVPLPYIISPEGLPAEVGASYTGSTLFTRLENGKVEDVDLAASEDKDVAANVAEEKSPYRTGMDGYKR